MLHNKFVITLLLSFTALLGSAQSDSSRLRITLLTCTPGEPLYATFGHTAIRVTDSLENSDIVYNYGTFNFDDPGFYLKFVRGKLNYYLSAEYFQDFVYFYQYENRGITEQVLQLGPNEKKQLQQALKTNLQPQNKFYQYDFFFDNCTTRARDMVARYQDSTLPIKAVMPLGTSFREAIHWYLDKNHCDWNKLGIDILLGAPTDALMTAKQMQFLPDNLMYSLDSLNGSHAIVASKKDLYPLPNPNNKAPLLTPLLLFSLLAVLIFLCGFAKAPRMRIFINSFDGLFLFLTGLLGVILIFMWTATDHAMCRNNYNLLWAWPTHLVMAFFVSSKKRWAKVYWGVVAVAMLLLLVAWFFLPQQMNNALLPLVVLLAYRSGWRYFQK